MDLEARSLPPGVKSSLLVKLREFKSDLNNFKTEVKRITSGNLNAAARDELLEAGLADTKTVCQKESHSLVSLSTSFASLKHLFLRSGFSRSTIKTDDVNRTFGPYFRQTQGQS